MITRSLLLAPLLALAACAADGPAPDFERTAQDQERLDQRLVGLASTGRVSCVPAFEAREQRIIDERTILFYTGRNRVYRTEIENCPRLDRRSTIIRRSTVPSICRNEIFEVRDSGTQFSYGSCTFGDFERFERVGS